jgi:hypothetical protein
MRDQDFLGFWDDGTDSVDTAQTVERRVIHYLGSVPLAE